MHRQPFPGPGLGHPHHRRSDAEKLAILKDADAIVREELDAYNEQLYERTGDARAAEGRSVWQYFAVLPDIKSVGVMGDERTYGYPIILRAVEIERRDDGDWAKLPYDVLARYRAASWPKCRREPRGLRHHQQAARDETTRTYSYPLGPAGPGISPGLRGRLISLNGSGGRSSTGTGP